MSPIVPGFSSRPALLERTMKAAVEHGARFVGSNVMHLEGGTRDHFMRWLETERPELVDGYRQLYASKYASQGYRDEVKKVMTGLRAKHALVSPGGERVGATHASPPRMAPNS
jgi:DNA repair photolyase